MHCINCSYVIENWKENKCPHCGTDVLDTCVTVFFHAKTKEERDDAFHGIYKNTFPWLKKKVWDSLEVYSETIDIEQEVNDVLADIYLKVLNNISKYDLEKSSFRTWFNHVIENFLIDRYRRLAKKREYIPDEPEFWEEIPDVKACAPGQVVNHAKELLQTLLESISAEQRKCIVLHDIEGLSNKEIAERLQISENTVKTRIFYGRKAIEKRGLELKGQGRYVYSLSPVVLFLWLYENQKVQAAGMEETWAKVKIGLNKYPFPVHKQNAITRKPEPSVAHKAGALAGKKAAGIIAGAATVAVIGAGIYYTVQKPEAMPEPVPVETEEGKTEEAQMEEPVVNIEPVEPDESTAPVSEESPYNIPDDMLPGYQDVLVAYGQASSQVPVEHPENLGGDGYGMYAAASVFEDNGILTTEYSGWKIYYALKDINEDGYEELLLTPDAEQPQMYDLQVWTNDGENAYEVMSSAYRYQVYLRAHGVIMDNADGGAFVQELRFHEFNNKGELTLLDQLSTETGEELCGVSIYDEPYTEEIEWTPILKD